MSLAPGMMVTPNVRLVELLGQGGMGSVWVADHLTLETQVAVKFISPQATLGGQDELLERFRREAKAAAKIKSAHVVQTFDHGVTADGVPYIVMELLEGESLGDRLRRVGRLTLGDMAEVLEQAGKALSSAHRLDIVHRDVKPDNIFLTIRDDELFVKVLDFGVAKDVGAASAHDMTGTSTVLGSPHYMSPEQLMSARGISFRADLWALAVVTYHGITGEVPFEGETLTALCMNICTAPLEPPSQRSPDLPATLDWWFNRALARDPEARFSSAKEMAESFRAVIVGSDITTDIIPPDSSVRMGQVPAGMDTGAAQGPAAGVQPSSGQVEPPASRPGPVSGAVEAPLSLEFSSSGEAATVLLEPEQVSRAAASLEAAEAAMAAASSRATGAAVSTVGAGHSSTLTSAGVAASSAPVGRSASAVGAAGDAGGQGVPVATFGGAAAPLDGSVSPTGKARLWVMALIATVIVVVGVGAALYWLEQRSAEPVAVAASGSESGVQSSSTPPPAKPAPSATASAAKSDSRRIPTGMVGVAAGRYEVGCDPEDKRDCFEDEQPRHVVDSPGFAIMQHEVTMSEYDECAAAGACPPAGKGKGCTWQQDGKERFPINCVSWSAARAYCVHRGWRLPTETEWEIAARGSDPRSYPWGDDPPTCDRAVIRLGGPGGCGSGGPLAVGARPTDKSWVGAFDLGGNVREWTSSDYGPYPGGTPEPGRAGKVNRGGSWSMRPQEMTASYTRGVDAANEARPDLGFRCAADL